MAKKKKKKQQSLHIPELFFDRLSTMYGQPVFGQLQQSFLERPTTFRINTIRSNKDEVLQELQQQGLKIRTVPWYADAYILESKTKRDLTETVVYKQGKIYIQSLASMVPPLILDPKPGEKVLDLTAAPGSKTSQIAALMKKKGEIVANDVNTVRFFKLQHNMEHLGVVADSDDWTFMLRKEHGAVLCREYEEYFDKILLDAPCSAEARFVEGKPKTYGYWKERKIKEMAYKQRKLLLASWNALKPGGRLVYSTCTFAPEENEVQIQRLISRFEDVRVESINLNGLKPLPALETWKKHEFSKEIKKTLRIMPTKDIEGFYVASLLKQS